MKEMYLKGKSYIPGTIDRIETFEFDTEPTEVPTATTDFSVIGGMITENKKLGTVVVRIAVQGTETDNNP